MGQAAHFTNLPALSVLTRQIERSSADRDLSFARFHH
jgi:hypothetical protein